MGNPKLGLILRCTGLALVVLGAFVLLPAAAQAQCIPGQHGVSIFKSCISPKNRCATDADCSDADFCNGIEQCATEESPGSNVLDCDITLGNPITHCDNETILEAADAVLNATGPGASSSTIVIASASGVVSGTCTAGTDLGGAVTCTIAPGGDVHFRANYYTTVFTDPTPLNDQASVTVSDTCSGSPSGCSSTPNTVQFTAATDTVSGCSPGTPLVCNDNNACTSDSCVPATGCVFTPNPPCNDNNACTTDTCDPAIGCVFTPNAPCNDNNACTTDTCDPVLGCVFTPNAPCDDNNTCTDDTCDPVLGCVFTDNGSCVTNEICRTPGFWGTHACGLTGTCEKTNSQNITLDVLANFGGALTICGATIDNTNEGNANSALEAICVSPKGDSRLQLARQLMAAALNCGISNSTDTDICTGAGESAANPCGGVSIEDVFNACNDACPTGTTATVDGHEVSCIGALDCFNNGGVFDVATGECGAAEGTSCHDRELVNGCFSFEPPGPAGSPKACNDARKNDITVVPPLP